MSTLKCLELDENVEDEDGRGVLGEAFRARRSRSTTSSRRLAASEADEAVRWRGCVALEDMGEGLESVSSSSPTVCIIRLDIEEEGAFTTEGNSRVTLAIFIGEGQAQS